jgi:hypothetical protein
MSAQKADATTDDLERLAAVWCGAGSHAAGSDACGPAFIHLNYASKMELTTPPFDP